MSTISDRRTRPLPFDPVAPRTRGWREPRREQFFLRDSPVTDWTTFDRLHVWHPYTQMQTAPAPIPVASAEGMYLITPDGRRILDGISSWWVNIHGHSHPRLAAALARQAETLEQVIFAGFTHEPAARLAARLAATTPARLTRAFFSDDGSTAVEVALKMAAQYWTIQGQERHAFAALDHAYHGDTFGAMAAGGVGVFHQAFEPFFCEVLRAPSPYSYHFDGGRDPDACVASCLDALERLFRERGSDIAAFIIEPMVQGAGGMIVWPAAYLRSVRELCDRFGILLIADEVMTGFGRTGLRFACEHGPIEPDLICLSKALTGGTMPLAVTLATEEIYAAFLSEDRGRTFFHGHSFTANALSCAVALESLDLLEDIEASGRLKDIEQRFRVRLDALRDFPIVGDTRGLGTIAAIELEGGAGYLDDVGPRLAAEFLARDILLRPLGNVLYVLPPYVITDAEIDRVFDAVEDVLASLAPV